MSRKSRSTRRSSRSASPAPLATPARREARLKWAMIAGVLLVIAVVMGRLLWPAPRTAHDSATSSADASSSPAATSPNLVSPTAPEDNPRATSLADNASSSLSTSSSSSSSPREPAAQLVTAHSQSYEQQLDASVDPGRDGWQSEQLAEVATQQLKQLLRLLDTKPTAEPSWPSLLDREFACTPLRPAPLSRLYRDDMVLAEAAAPTALQVPPSLRGADGLRQAILALRARVPNTAQVDTAAKLFAVQVKDGMLAGRAHIELDARPPIARSQIRTNWECLWRIVPAGSNALPKLLLSAIRVSDFQESIARDPSADWFVDSTSAILGHNHVYAQQLMPGLDDWLQHIERVTRMHVFMACGLAVGDANGDGLDDLYLCQPGGLPNRLFVQNLDGTADEVAWRARVDWLDSTSSALFVDLDNDRDQDLVLATLSGLVIMQNDGPARYHLVGTLPTDGSDMQSLSAADYDNDGDLDLYVCMNFPKVTVPSGEQPNRFTYHDANDGAANHLFRNEWSTEQTWKFTDVTVASGIDQDNRRHSLAASWEDYDNDGDQDLYVANDYGQNCLYQNEGGKFRNVAKEVGVVDQGSGMSVSWSDINGDGRMDLYVGNMFSNAGSRITAQPGFRPGIDDTTRAVLRRFAKGNSLFLNRPSGAFQDLGATAGVEMARWAWSSIFCDLNNSGHEDILVANGYMTTEDTGDL